MAAHPHICLTVIVRPPPPKHTHTRARPTLRKTQVCTSPACLMTLMPTRWRVCLQSVASSSWMMQGSHASSCTGGATARRSTAQNSLCYMYTCSKCQALLPETLQLDNKLLVLCSSTQHMAQQRPDNNACRRCGDDHVSKHTVGVRRCCRVLAVAAMQHRQPDLSPHLTDGLFAAVHAQRPNSSQLSSGTRRQACSREMGWSHTSRPPQ